MKSFFSVPVFAFSLLLSQQAAATVITFDNWIHDSGSDPADYVVTVDDETNAGFLNFNISVNTSTLPDADLFGFFLDSGGNLDSSNTIINGADVTGVYFDTLSCGGNGCNLNGLTDDPFDVAVRLQDSGSSAGNLTWTNFTLLLVSDLSIYDIDRVGIRAQSSGLDGIGSDKALSYSVPEPAPVALIGAGLIMMFGFSRKFSRS
ncbi:PEP-CTERM sorting domain-containing protein [Kaarinaea lacus]